MKKVLTKTGMALGALFILSGCSALQETMQAQFEVPTLEKQANRVAVGMTIVRENNIEAKKMEISADAKWPKLITSPITEEEKMKLKKLILDDPYFATVNYTEPLQRQKLGSGYLMNQLGGAGQIAGALLNQNITPLMYRAFYKLEIFYGDDPKKWPSIFNFDTSASNFEEFPDGDFQQPEALSGDVYKNVMDAFIALIPTNMQKDVELAKDDMNEAFKVVLDLKKEQSELETKLKTDEARKAAKEDNVKAADLKGLDIKEDYTPLTQDEINQINERLSVLEEQIDEAEEIADQKEAIYFELLDQAQIALQSDINIDDEAYVKLAQNINLVAKDIQESAVEAYTTFGLAAASIAANGIIQNFPKELETLAMARMSIPENLQDKYNERIRRLVKNTIYILPNMIMGTYYAHKQSVLAEKYEDFTNIILEAYNTKIEQEAEKNAPKEEQKEATEDNKGA